MLYEALLRGSFTGSHYSAYHTHRQSGSVGSAPAKGGGGEHLHQIGGEHLHQGGGEDLHQIGGEHLPHHTGGGVAEVALCAEC